MALQMNGICVCSCARAVKRAVRDGIRAANVGAIVNLDAFQRAIINRKVNALKVRLIRIQTVRSAAGDGQVLKGDRRGCILAPPFIRKRDVRIDRQSIRTITVCTDKLEVDEMKLFAVSIIMRRASAHCQQMAMIRLIIRHVASDGIGKRCVAAVVDIRKELFKSSCARCAALPEFIACRQL